jgi:hypothetical protein
MPCKTGTFTHLRAARPPIPREVQARGCVPRGRQYSQSLRAASNHPDDKLDTWTRHGTTALEQQRLVVPRVSISGSADAFDRAAGAADQNCQGARAAVAVAGPDSWRHLAYGPVRRSAASVRKTARRTLGYGRAMTFTPEDKAESCNSTVSAPVVPSGTSNETAAVMELPGLIRTLDAPAQTAAILSGMK